MSCLSRKSWTLKTLKYPTKIHWQSRRHSAMIQLLTYRRHCVPKTVYQSRFRLTTNLKVMKINPLFQITLIATKRSPFLCQQSQKIVKSIFPIFHTKWIVLRLFLSLAKHFAHAIDALRCLMWNMSFLFEIRLIDMHLNIRRQTILFYVSWTSGNESETHSSWPVCTLYSIYH